MNALFQDLRFAVRLFAARPGLAVTSVLVLGVGLGVTTSMWKLVDELLLRPLPAIEDQERLVQIGRTQQGEGFDTVSFPYFRALAEGASHLDRLVAHDRIEATLRAGDASERVAVALVSEGYFGALGTGMAAGRPLGSGGDAGRDAPVAVVGWSLAERLLGGPQAAVGRAVEVAGERLEVVGVAARGFRGVEKVGTVEVWVPLELQPRLLASDADLFAAPDVVWLELFGRLAAGSTPAAAEAELQAIAAGLAAADPESYGGKSVEVVPRLGLGPGARRELGAFHGRLMALAALVLLVACVNVALLLLVHGVERRQELSIRLALGGGPRRLLRQLSTEALLLGVGGALVAVLLAASSQELVRLLLSASPLGAAAARELELAVDARLVAFAFAASLLTTLVFGVAPAIATTRRATARTVRGGRGATGASSRARDAGIALQLALCVVLLVVAGLSLRSLGRSLAIDPGFDADRVAAIELELEGRLEPGEKTALASRVVERVGALPGVEAAALGLPVPLAGSRWSTRLVPPGAGEGEATFESDFRVVTPDYFRVMGVPLLAGRGFTSADRLGGAPVIVVGRALASRLWPVGEAVGRRVRMSWDERMRDHEVVGVVADMKVLALSEDPRPHFYFPLHQQLDQPYFDRLVLHVRAESGDPLALVPAVRRAVEELAPGLPLFDAFRLDEPLRRSVGEVRVVGILGGVLGALALLLAGVGLYGALAYAVRHRRRELGIRRALGADERALALQVVRQGMLPVVVGAILGLALAVAAGRALSGSLYGVEPHDPATYLSVLAVLAAVSVVALYVPARRAGRVAPSEALLPE